MAPVTKSWMYPFSFIKRVEDLQKEKTGKDFKLSSIEWEVSNLTSNDGTGTKRNGMLYINRVENQKGLDRMSDKQISSYDIPQLNEIKQNGDRPADDTEYSFNFKLGDLITDTRLKDSVTLFDSSNDAHRMSFNMLSERQSFDQ